MATLTAKEKLSTLIDTSIATLAGQGVSLTDAQKTSLYTAASNWIDAQADTSVSLSATKPEFQQIVLQFQNALETQQVWRDTLTAGTGQALVRFISSALAFAVLAQERATQERFPVTAKLPSSIFAAARSHGVHIQRRTPANVSVTLTRLGTPYLLIPKMTSFSINSVLYFNREPIVFAAGDASSVVAILYQGQVQHDTYIASGASLATYEIGQGDWTLSDADLVLKVDGVEWESTQTAIFRAKPNEKLYYTNTFANGNIEITTGSGNYGALPSAGSALDITYVVTLGASMADAATGLEVLCVDVAGVVGLTTTPIAGGIDPKPASFYKTNASHMYSRRERAVTRRDYESTILNYTGVDILDVRVLGQQEIDPARKAWGNVIKVAVLTAASAVGAPLTGPQWNDLAAYIAAYGIDQLTVLREDPVSVALPITVEVGINPDGNIDTTERAVRTLINATYAPKSNALGRSFYVQDLTRLLANGLDPAIAAKVNYVKPTAPPTPTSLVLTPLQWLKLSTLSLSVVYTDRDYTNRQTGL